MPRCLVVCGLLLLGLSSCLDDRPESPRLDFIGGTGLTSNNRVLSTPGDTLTTKVLATATPELRQFTVTVDYTPFLLSTDSANTAPVLYLEQALSTDTFTYRQQFSARTQSGREEWTYTVTDPDGQPASRRYLLTVRNPDSARTYHSYQVPLYAARDNGRRSALAARAGLVFPARTVAANAPLSSSIDLVLLPVGAGAVALASPTDAAVAASPAVAVGTWTSAQATQLKTTRLTPAQFDQLTTSARLTSLFDTAAAPTRTYIGPLAKDQVLTFRTATGQRGALHVKTLFGTTAAPAALVRVRVNKN